MEIHKRAAAAAKGAQTRKLRKAERERREAEIVQRLFKRIISGGAPTAPAEESPNGQGENANG